MYRFKFTLLALFLTVFTYGQNISLLKNFNPKAKALKHSLNKTRDSLFLVCEQNIIKVDIFNEDYEKIVNVDDSEIKISLKDLPVGKFEVEVKLDDKIILMHLIRFTDHKTTSNNYSLAQQHTNKNQKGMMLDENLNAVKTLPNSSVENLLSGRKRKNSTKKKKFYWVIRQTNNKLGSHKSMKLVDKASADRMIRKNQLEINSASGKYNELIVWEVYNTSQFVRKQRLNPDFVYTASTEIFNNIPYYEKQNNLKQP